MPPAPLCAQGPLGIALTDPKAGFPESFLAATAAAGVSTVDSTRGLELFLGYKDPEAVAQVKHVLKSRACPCTFACPLPLLCRFAKLEPSSPGWPATCS